MKGLIKSLLTLIALISVFFFGFHLGREKEKAKIPIFQDDSDKTA